MHHEIESSTASGEGGGGGIVHLTFVMNFPPPSPLQGRTAAQSGRSFDSLIFQLVSSTASRAGGHGIQLLYSTLKLL